MSNWSRNEFIKSITIKKSKIRINIRVESGALDEDMGGDGGESGKFESSMISIGILLKCGLLKVCFGVCLELNTLEFDLDNS